MRLTLALVVLAVLTACGPGPNYRPPESTTTTVESWASSSEVSAMCGAFDSPGRVATCFELAEKLELVGCSIQAFREVISGIDAGVGQDVLNRNLAGDGCDLG